MMQLGPNLYTDRHVLKENVTCLINISIKQEDIGNVVLEFCMLPKPLNTQEWGYVITIALRDILDGEELYAHYFVN